MFLLDSLDKTTTSFAIVIEESLIFNFAVDHKVHYNLEIQRKTNLKTASANCFHPANARARSSATSRARATPAAVRTLREHAEALADPAVHAPCRECYCW
jgi:hypothetical protein